MAHRLSNEEIDLTNVYGFFTKDEVAQEFTINALFQVNDNCLDLGMGAGLEKMGIHGIQDTRQRVGDKTNVMLSNVIELKSYDQI